MIGDRRRGEDAGPQQGGPQHPGNNNNNSSSNNNKTNKQTNPGIKNDIDLAFQKTTTITMRKTRHPQGGLPNQKKIKR